MQESLNQKTAQQHLDLIESMINRARDKFTENGHLYLLWGWVVLICSVSHFVMAYFQIIDHPEAVWMLTWAAFIYQVVYLIKVKRKRKVKTYSDEILANVWLVFVVCMFLIGFILAKNNTFIKVYPVLLVLYGMPTFLSGKILKVPALSAGGVCCWVLALMATFIPFIFQLLLLALAVIAAWIIPGYVLQARYKKQL